MPFRIAVLLGFEICGAALTLFRPYLGVLFLVLLVFTRPADDRPNMQDLHFPMVFTSAVLMATIARFPALGDRIWTAIKQIKLFLVLYAMAFISAVANSFTPESQSQLDESLVILLTCFLLLVWVRTEKRLWGLLWVLLAAGLYYVNETVRNPRFIQEEIGNSQFERLAFRDISNFGDPNYLALFMVLLIFVGLGMLHGEGKKWIRLATFCLLGSFTFVFVRCQSRGATMGFAGGLIVYWLLQRRKLKTGLVIAIAVCITLLLVPQSYLDRMQTVAHYQEDSSAMNRLELWNIAMGLIAENPALGVGPGNFRRHAFNHVHNSYLEITSEVGVAALIVYILMLGSAIRAVVRARAVAEAKDAPWLTGISEGLLCSMIPLVIQGFFTGFAFREFLYIFLTLAYCVHGLAEDWEISEAGKIDVPAEAVVVS